jgi:hypothetical protein
MTVLHSIAPAIKPAAILSLQALDLVSGSMDLRPSTRGELRLAPRLVGMV